MTNHRREHQNVHHIRIIADEALFLANRNFLSSSLTYWQGETHFSAHQEAQFKCHKFYLLRYITHLLLLTITACLLVYLSQRLRSLSWGCAWMTCGVAQLLWSRRRWNVVGFASFPRERNFLRQRISWLARPSPTNVPWIVKVWKSPGSFMLEKILAKLTVGTVWRDQILLGVYCLFLLFGLELHWNFEDSGASGADWRKFTENWQTNGTDKPDVDQVSVAEASSAIINFDGRWKSQFASQWDIWQEDPQENL